MADVKGDFSGIANAGAPNEKMKERLAERGQEPRELESSFEQVS